MPPNSAVLIVLCTCPDEAVAAGIATALVAGGLAACVNRIPAMRSMYRWEGRIQDDAEVLLVIKTTADRYGALEAVIRTRHPYDLPEVIALPVAAGTPGSLAGAYQEWIEQATRP